jgi:hypothetical protein
MAREDARQYWEEQLAEYWGSGFSIPEYCELKELSYESARRWVRIFEKERNTASGTEDEVIELVEVKPPRAVFDPKNSGVRLKIGPVNILLEKDFDESVLSEVLKLLEAV